MGPAIDQLVRILTASIAPVIVISGVGLLLLSMTNSYGRVILRARELTREMDNGADDARCKLLADQVRIIYRRARTLRVAIILSAVSILFVAVTVLIIFSGQVLNVNVGYIATPCFGLSLVALLGSLYYFIQDITISLKALELEVASYVEK